MVGRHICRIFRIDGPGWATMPYGGLGAATKWRLADLAKTIERDGDLARSRAGLGSSSHSSSRSCEFSLLAAISGGDNAQTTNITIHIVAA